MSQTPSRRQVVACTVISYDGGARYPTDWALRAAHNRAMPSSRHDVRVPPGTRSPYLIGGLVAAVAYSAYLAVKISSMRSLARSATIAPAQSPPPHKLPYDPAKVAYGSPRAQVSAQEPAAASWSGVIGEQRVMIKAAFNAWIDDFAPSMGAALSYYTLFSLAPLLLIVIAVAGMVYGQDAAQGAIVAQLGGIMGNDGAAAVEAMLKAAREPAKGVLATVIGLIVLLIGATAIFAELQSALDRIWRVPAPKQQSGIWNLLRTRLLSFGLVLGLGFLLVVSLVVSAALAALGQWWGSWLQGWDVLLEILNFTVSLAIFTVLFAMVYKIMPRARISWRDVWTGAAVTALLFTVGKVGVGVYLGKSSLASGFGAAGSLVLLIAWVYYSAQIFLLGAEYTWVFANRHGSRADRSLLDAAPAVPIQT